MIASHETCEYVDKTEGEEVKKILYKTSVYLRRITVMNYEMWFPLQLMQSFIIEGETVLIKCRHLIWTVSSYRRD
jgi:hypothetical protein